MNYELCPWFELLQNPRQADTMTKVQAELDETRIVLVGFCL